MLPLTKKNIFLLLSLLFLVGAAFNYWVLEKDAPAASLQQFVSSINRNTSKEISQSKSELVEIATSLQKKKLQSFSDFDYSESAKYPYYVFKDGSLVYWSDNHYVPDYQLINTNNETAILNLEDKKYIVNKVGFRHEGHQYQVVSLINLYQQINTQNHYLKTGYNLSIFYVEPIGIGSSPSTKTHLNIPDEKGNFLFSVIPPKASRILSPTIPQNTLLFLLISVFLLGIFVWFWIDELMKKHQFGRAFIVLAIYLLLVRYLMIINNIPIIFYESDLFNPRFLYINKVAPSLGDMLLNALFVLALVSYLNNYLYRFTLYYLIIKTPLRIQNVLSMLMVATAMVLSYWYWDSLHDVSIKSDYQLDFGLAITFPLLKVGVMIYYLFLGINFFISLHILISLFLRLNKSFKKGFVLWLMGMLIGCILLIITDSFRWVFLAVGIYFLYAYWAGFPRFFYNFRYKTTLYFFSGAFVYALLGVSVLYKQQNQKILLDKKIYGEQFLAENDLLTERLMTKITREIRQDTAIQQAMLRSTFASEQTQELIQRQFLPIYLDKYETDITVFDKNGQNLDRTEGAKTLESYQNLVRQSKPTTDAHTYFLTGVENNYIAQYLSIIEVPNSGTIILDLKLRNNALGTVYPSELILSKKFGQIPDPKIYSYAIYDKQNRLIYSIGSYNYARKLSIEKLSNPSLYNEGIVLNDYHHNAIKGNNRTIVISSKYQFLNNIFANFAFLFLFSVICIVIVMVSYALRFSYEGFNVNFSTKIQLFLNAAFLLPLLLVVIITLSVIDSTFLANQEKSYLDNTKNLSSTIQIQVNSFLQKLKSKAFLQEEINELARETKVDINLYDYSGKLILSTRPLIYEYGLLSNFINPQAYRRIAEEKENEIILNETLGTLDYKTTYINVKDASGKQMGIVGIPFFDAKPNLDRQITDVVASILSVFAWLFLFLLIMSYFASNILTNPLRMVAQKLKKTNLDNVNERLEWRSNDEIGLLMREYNKMIKKLEESKVALSQSEKQTAWREMAKQVAHEIKNPLTPMKLSVQQLQRTLSVDNPQTQEKITRALNSLTEQIDNISEIANSFSEFAKMPIPRNEYFDLVPLIQKSADLYAEDERISLNAYIKEKEAWVMGDRQFMSRVITNLIINGIQSVPADRRPIINLRLYKNEDDNIAIIEVQDNGKGIEENIRQKVFLPNFTTKRSGSGLGLAMARRGVEHAGGNIWFETTEGKGTTFFIDLPLAQRV